MVKVPKFGSFFCQNFKFLFIKHPIYCRAHLKQVDFDSKTIFDFCVLEENLGNQQ